ncbi:MAG: UDP-N-acetylglucosamine--N-acetylmuramyl-(pentapeptide) pyrophosphoryl-undecaprenol N-acetylglucosamine transferase [Candidatus Jacksonbacteria bacterium]|jgi:UDP-N-acetylglucosamine--N-acetylmuramyl-(pentapeptide) pyrophosphoryl-undecaprenol N-acetylglucosamine transferase|nr:UDP-N-acetylglucosamine--N-acetylmuramyl-(pentapeptide) pyrophosphoryl-undecaprenol N-acetylglucosamine transferase [Candidatus Jacksonbacteria bacterium]MBT6034021.1 UDP-N-acetylglucosamine--N-acetylmuramyl-(pentapeptide) pyrophosphoryl-undecaprenol N-acetylglucosamine transferase [Candidatus Jacksonbacteria bacterium]MBT7338534.1 UDP-N-acetylglucosamine--N-acetylmuramyl-(pentapeptide) pyrophosphoryl-undecaprenol N-acetylglucosamine transferase [Candidatus Jacksonbacteria bacterium]
MKRDQLKIMLAGGGTMGSVSPLLGMAEELKKRHKDLLLVFVGTKAGPERKAVADAGIRYQPIAAGKWRKYVSLYNVIDLFRIATGFVQSVLLLKKEKPDAILTAGSFVAVPVVWAAGFFKIPVFAHQQDLDKGLANKLIEKTAVKITVTFQESLKEFSSAKTIWTGNPVRQYLVEAQAQDGVDLFKLDAQKRTVVIVGGGTGSEWINEFVEEHKSALLPYCQIIHVTGAGKGEESHEQGYQSFEFLEAKDMALAYAVADIVICRAGISTITELSQLSKPAIVIPLPDSHQEDNAAFLWEKKAAIILDQTELSVDQFMKVFKDLLFKQQNRLALTRAIARLMPQDATEKVVDVIDKELGYDVH